MARLWRRQHQGSGDRADSIVHLAVGDQTDETTLLPVDRQMPAFNAWASQAGQIGKGPLTTHLGRSPTAAAQSAEAYGTWLKPDEKTPPDTQSSGVETHCAGVAASDVRLSS